MNDNKVKDGHLLYYQEPYVILDEIKDGVYTERARLHLGRAVDDNGDVDEFKGVHINGMTIIEMTLIPKNEYEELKNYKHSLWSRLRGVFAKEKS